MRQRAQLFKRLEATETMRTYITHNMDDSEELCAKLELVEDKLIAAWKITDEWAKLRRKVEEKKEAVKAEACLLAEEREVMEAGKKKD